MASNYDITMKQYNGADYDTLYPKNISQQVLLNDSSFAQLIDLTVDAPSVLDGVKRIYESLGEVSGALNSEVIRIENKVIGLTSYGSYTGTGTTTKTLTFSYFPKLILIIGHYTSGQGSTSGLSLSVFMRTNNQTSVPDYGLLIGNNYCQFLSAAWSISGSNYNLTFTTQEPMEPNITSVKYSYVAIG